ncbi:vasopressin V1a receptor-like [Tachypleus tridentatus]|uniref:vasopressin V1a receptor-like n=1 Tax=Tachypleus tridentatus TaxID=6853 RepID=UPI003FD42899
MVALVFVIPLLVISACYISIVQKISEKADGVVYQTTFSKGPRTATLALSRFPNNWLFRAKQKTSRMTFVIITSFLLCSAPYCIVEMWRMYGDASSLDAMTYSILAALAVSNSSTNPLVFMFFHFSSGVRRPSRALSRQQTGSPKANFIRSIFHQRKVPTCSRQDKKEKTGLVEIFPDVKSKDTSMDNSCSIRNVHHQRVRAEISHESANHLEESKEL